MLNGIKVKPTHKSTAAIDVKKNLVNSLWVSFLFIRTIRIMLKIIAPGMNTDRHENINVLETTSISGGLRSEQETFVVWFNSSTLDMLANFAPCNAILFNKRIAKHIYCTINSSTKNMNI